MVFSALADPTRRAILAQLAERDATVTELTAPHPISMPAVSRHLKVLEGAALISRTRSGKWRASRLETAPLRDAADWIAQGIFQKGLAEELVGGLGEEAFLELALFEGLLLVFARVVQGIGGAMMVPVGRLVILKSVPKHELVGSLVMTVQPLPKKQGRALLLSVAAYGAATVVWGISRSFPLTLLGALVIYNLVVAALAIPTEVLRQAGWVVPMRADGSLWPPIVTADIASIDWRPRAGCSMVTTVTSSPPSSGSCTGCSATTRSSTRRSARPRARSRISGPVVRSSKRPAANRRRSCGSPG